MVHSFIQDIKKQNQPTSANTKLKQQNVKRYSAYKGAMYGAMLGVGAGLADGAVSTFYIKKDLKKTLDIFKNASFADKKLMVQNLLENGKTVNDFKRYAKKVSNSSALKLMFKRGLIYGGIISAAGFVADLSRNYSSKSKVNN